MKKLFATLLTLALLITGICYLAPEANEVKAADTTDKNYITVEQGSDEYTLEDGVPTKDGYLFAGYFTSQDCKIATRSREKDAKYIKFVRKEVMDVKVQITDGVVSKSDNEKYVGKYVIRFTSSVDGLNYRNIGFELEYEDGRTVRHTTTKVFKSIESTVGTVAGKADTYEFSPNLLSTDSQYFMTVKLPVAKDAVDEEYTVRAFWTTLDGTEVFGQERTVSVKDGNGDIVNLPVSKALDKNTEYVATYTNASGETRTGTVTVLSDGTARITLAEGDEAIKLKSVTQFTINVNDEKVEDVLYRNYYRSHEPEDGSTTPVADTSWYDMYPNATEYTIASPADLYGLAKLVNESTEVFKDKTVNMVKDITVNKGRVKRYRETGSESAWVADSGEKTYDWTPIGSERQFNGTFDGHNHEISGIYLNNTSRKQGFFGNTGTSSILKNFKFTNSYIKATGDCVGLVGASYGLKYENIYNDATISYTSGYAGGFVGFLGTADTGKQQIFNNCWFDGEIYHGGGNYTSAFVGIIGQKCDVKMTNCLFTGDVVGVSAGVHTGNNYGTFVGYGGTAGTKVEIKNCMVAGYVKLKGEPGQGLLVGNLSANNVTGSMTNVYLISEPTDTTVPLQWTGNTAITTDKAGRVESNSMTSLSKEELLEKFPILDGEEQATWVCVEGETPILKTFASWYKGREKAIVPNTSWYAAASATQKYTITTAEEFLGFRDLSQSNTFKDWEITLGADIVLNDVDEDTVEAWKNGEEPLNKWNDTVIGTYYYPFMGTFDGDGHTISGLHIKATNNYRGLFSYVTGDADTQAVIKNFKLVDSYMETSKGYFGLIGYLDGNTVCENIYTNAVIVSTATGTGSGVGYCVGGIAATVGLAKCTGYPVRISRCWTDGELYAKGTTLNAASVVGNVGTLGEGVTLTIENCLNSAMHYNTTSPSDELLYAGGFVGRVAAGSGNIVFRNLVDVGQIYAKNAWYYCGSLVGVPLSGRTWDISNVYSLGIIHFEKDGTTQYRTIGTEQANMGSDSRTKYRVSREALVATEDSALTTLFGEGQTAWECDSISNNTDRGTPILSHINEDNWWANRQTVTEYTIQADTSWYEEALAKKEYEITTAEELYGLAQLSQTKDFYGWEITLGADIELNYVDKDTVAAWKDGAEPLNKWTPIGTSTTTMPFRGTFDGKGHTISGLYMNTSTRYNGMFARVTGAVIKNFKLVDSYMRTTNRDFGIVGYSVGDITLQNVYSDAILVVSTTGTNTIVTTTGKLVGYLETSGTTIIEGCWSDGEIIVDKGGSYVAGLIGYLNVNGGKFTLRNCLNSADIVSTTGDSNYLGGFIGEVDAATATDITMTNCLDAGSIKKVGTAISQVGSFIGFNNTASATWNGTLKGDKNDDCRVYSIGNAYYNDTPVGKTIGNSKTNYTTTQFLTTRTELLATTEAELEALFGSNQTAWECDSVKNDTNRGTPILSYFNEDNWWANRQNDVNLAITPDTSWYDSKADKFLLTTAEQLYGLAELSQRYNFEGQEIKLGADIALNYVGEDTVETWKDGAYAINKWLSVGSSSKPFKGTFDGQGHTISGLYINTSTQYYGMFGQVNGATIKNFKVVDSYMRTTYREFGLVGLVDGDFTLQNVYSDAVLVVSESSTKTTGKFIGQLKGSGTVIIEGCWSDGEIIIDGGGNYVAGFIGFLSKSEGDFTLRYCLNSADIVSTGDSDYLGGFVGQMTSAANITMTDCLDVGSIQKVGTKTGQVGSFIGFNQTANATWNGVLKGDKNDDCRVYSIGNAYYNDTPVGKTIGNSESNYTTTQFLTSRTLLLATTEEELEALFGEGQTAWVCDIAIDGAKRGTPILATFADWWVERAPEVVEGYIVPDTSWYEEAETAGKYEIETAEEMYGFSLLSQEHSFDGIEITLGNDIELNIVEDGTVAAWEEGTQPVNNWTPIGTSGNPFAGTFDGKGKTISGLYANSDVAPMGLFGVTAAGSEVKDFRIEDSYLKLTNTSENPVGSVVGKLGGDMSNVYSNAIIYHDYSKTGGLVGEVLSWDGTAVGKGHLQVFIENCWFDGKIVGGATETARRVGGIVGKLHYGKLTMNNVLFTGTIDSDVTHARAYIGGLVGVTQEEHDGLELHINSAISAGKITGNFKNSTCVGSIVGSLLGSYESVVGTEGLPQYSFTNVFATRDCYNIPYAEYVYKENGESTVSNITGTVVMSSGDDRLLGYIPQGINGIAFTDEKKTVTVKDGLLDYTEKTYEAPYTGMREAEYAQLDFQSENGWVMRKEGVPVLKCFEELAGATTDATALAAEIGLDIDIKTNAVPKGAGNYVITHNEADASTYNNYVAALDELGFEPYIDNTGTAMADDGVRSATFVKKANGTSGEWVINVTYVDNDVTEKTGEYYLSKKTAWNDTEYYEIENNFDATPSKKLYISISTDTASLSPNLKAENVTNVGENAVTLSMLEDLTGKATDGSNAFVFQLPNGHFIINDGGYDPKTLITYLRNLTPYADKTVVIDAWTITHFHDDHIAAIAKLIDDATLRDKVYVEGVYVSEPSTYGVNSWISYDAYNYANKVMKAFGMMSTQKGDEVPVYQVHMGQRYYFNGVTMDVVDTQEQHLEKYWSSYVTNSSMFLPDPSNTASTQFIFTVQNGDGVEDDKKVLLGGDATLVNMEYMMQAYGEDPNTFANINVFAAYHHGKNNTCVWNSEKGKREATTTWQDYMLNNEKNVAGAEHKFDVVFFPRHTLFEATEGGAYPDNTDDINQILIGKSKAYYTWSYGDTTAPTSDVKHGSVKLELGATVNAVVYKPWNASTVLDSTLEEY